MGGPADHHVRAQDPPGLRHGQVVLAQVQHVGAGGEGEVGPIVHREQRPVASRGRTQNGQGGQLAEGLQRAVLPLPGRSLVAQLDHFHPACERGLGELGEVPVFPAGIRAQVEAGGGQAIPGVHLPDGSVTVETRARESLSGAEREHAGSDRRT